MTTLYMQQAKSEREMLAGINESRSVVTYNNV